MKLLIHPPRLIATATDDYQGPEQWITAPEGFDPIADLDRYEVIDGALVEIIPSQVTRTQAFVVLQDAQDGLIEALNDADAEGNPVARFPTLADDVLAWGRDPARTLRELGYFDSQTWNRTDPLLTALGLAFGLTEDDKDALFRSAAGL